MELHFFASGVNCEVRAYKVEDVLSFIEARCRNKKGYPRPTELKNNDIPEFDGLRGEPVGDPMPYTYVYM